MIEFKMNKSTLLDESHPMFFSSQIYDNLDKYKSHITLIQVHLSDQNGNIEGSHDKQCLLEAKLAGREPVVVSKLADTIEIAISGAIDKLKGALESVEGLIQSNHI